MTSAIARSSARGELGLHIPTGLAEAGKLDVVLIVDVDAEFGTDGSGEMQVVHGVEIELIAQIAVWIERGGVNVGRNACEQGDEPTVNLFIIHRGSPARARVFPVQREFLLSF